MSAQAEDMSAEAGAAPSAASSVTQSVTPSAAPSVHPSAGITPAPGRWQRIARRVRVPLGFVLAIIYFWLAQPTPMAIALGTVVVALGLGLRAAASGHVRKNEELATTGPYAYTRNPLYLGSAVMAIGFALAARNLWLVLAMVLFSVVIYWPVIQAEEDFLRARFPEFAAYAAAVPRLAPRLRPWRASESGFSTALYRQHREYRALLGALLLLGAVIGKMLWQEAG